MINVEGTRILIEYRADLKTKVLELRAEACRLAAIARAIDAAIFPEDIKELEDYLKLQEAYSIKGLDKIIFNKE
jgi:hypothetical protein